MIGAGYLRALGLTLSFAGGYWLNGLQHDNADMATRIVVQDRVVEKVIVDRAETEKIRGQYLEFRENAYAEINRYKSRVAELGGLHVNAQCLPTSGADASGIAEGTAKLSAKAEEDYFSYEREYADQLQLFRMCRAELLKRSSK